MDTDARVDGPPDTEDEVSRDGDDSADGRGPRPSGGQPAPRLGSRVLLTWVELTVVGITGGILGATVGGPPGFLVYLATSLATVGIVFYNVNNLIKGWMDVAGVTEETDE